MTDNVTPITNTHVCASCKAVIRDGEVYLGHSEECMQPEIRMRRLERMTLEHRIVIDQLAELLRASVNTNERMSKTLETLATSHGEIVDALGSIVTRLATLEAQMKFHATRDERTGIAKQIGE